MGVERVRRGRGDVGWWNAAVWQLITSDEIRTR